MFVLIASNPCSGEASRQIFKIVPQRGRTRGGISSVLVHVLKQANAIDIIHSGEFLVNNSYVLETFTGWTKMANK
jgi:hypothetical protein